MPAIVEGFGVSKALQSNNLWLEHSLGTPRVCGMLQRQSSMRG
jgi:hypothetical protein